MHDQIESVSYRAAAAPAESWFAAPLIEKIILSDGGFILKSKRELGPFAGNVIEYLAKWSVERPKHTYLAQRGSDGAWEKVSYGEAMAQVRALAQFLVDSGASVTRPVVALTENSISHALVHLAALYAGIPFSAISSSYSSIPDAFPKLRLCIETLNPKVIFVESLAKLRDAVANVRPRDSVVLSNEPSEPGSIALRHALATESRLAPDLYKSCGPETIAKYIFTSGSTGSPKAVINTNRMISSNQQQLLQIFPFLDKRPPVLVDWLPWSHTFGGNQTFFLTLRHGGTMNIDAGKPVGGSFEQSIRNLREIQPTVYFNVPKAFEMLVPELEADTTFRRHFFGELDLIYYAGASLPQRIWTALERMSLDVRGERIPIVTAWGTTETAPLATGVHYHSCRADNIGLPVPGCEIKFAVSGDWYELRVRGVNVTPGYVGRDDLTSDAFDSDGFFKTGDAAQLADEDDASKGILFGGRLAEDFKLNSGTWVSVGAVKTNTLNVLLPIATHVVVAGHDREAIGLLLFTDEASIRGMSAQEAGGSFELNHPAIQAFIQNRLRQYNDNARGSSARVERVLLLKAPPSLAANEITDKGYVNQRAVLAGRAMDVERLYSSSADVIVI
ncbi:feruloyl-CoA synthase [Bradyrhizobium sp. CCGB12]|uniref:feruloyl-CoA synthase n=1 Tax=Bradyrhizobium sp. CCGB12 TaxID=2949632 RepID=UPI0020B3ACDE|nr:feruloyl-CoA synthase [Bradyrhizobium sp. CCGB12]MCP3387843.1 feruloyl-CoA synthase [Bradyrhizobium sp. CCGB12]